MVEIIFKASVVVLGMFFIVWGIAFFLTTYTCNGYQEATGKNTKVIALDCYIEDNGGWYIWQEYKYRLATKGQFK